MVLRGKKYKTCYRCSTANPQDALFCRNCGAPLNTDAFFQDVTSPLKRREPSKKTPYFVFLIAALIIGLAVGLVSSLSVFKR